MEWNRERKGDGRENKIYFAPLELNDRIYVRAETANTCQNRTFAFCNCRLSKISISDVISDYFDERITFHFPFMNSIRFIDFLQMLAQKIFDGMLLFLITRIEYL